MKKLMTITLAFALTLMLGGLASAMDMDHGDMKVGDMSPEASYKVMEDNLHMMKMDVESMENGADHKAAMKQMNDHMTTLHHGMGGMEAHAKKDGNQKLEASMKQMNKEMMITMKGMSVMKKDEKKGMSMMMDGITKMEKTMKNVKSMM